MQVLTYTIGEISKSRAEQILGLMALPDFQISESHMLEIIEYPEPNSKVPSSSGTSTKYHTAKATISRDIFIN
jgi:hypothetical protein